MTAFSEVLHACATPWRPKYTWDDDNRLTRVQGPGGVDVSYKYDSMGRMLTRVSGGVTTKYTWDGWNLVKEDDGTNVLRYHCPQGELFSIERNSTFYQVHTDALGSVRALTDSTGAVAASYTYGAWGETLSASHPSGWTLSTLFVGAFGIRFDSTTGLHYMRNRWYDAGLGRFISRDPIVKDWNEIGLSLQRHPQKILSEERNLYNYVDNSPIDWSDKTGLQKIVDAPTFNVPSDEYSQLRHARNVFGNKCPQLWHHICDAIYKACWAWCLHDPTVPPGYRDACVVGCETLNTQCHISGRWPRQTRPYWVPPIKDNPGGLP